MPFSNPPTHLVHFAVVDHHEVSAEPLHSSHRLLADQALVRSRFLILVVALGVNAPLTLQLVKLSAKLAFHGRDRLLTLQAAFRVLLVIGRAAFHCQSKQSARHTT